MRQLVYYVAVTLDGKIAGPDGSFDFFPMDEAYARQMNEEWGDGLPTAFHEAAGVTPPGTKWDTVLMGRATYELGLAEGVDSPYAHLQQYVFSKTLDQSDVPRVTIVDEDPVAFIQRLKAQPGGNIWLCGGGALAGTLAPEIDQLVLKINPVTAGAGIPLIGGEVFAPTRWRLTGCRTFDLGVILASYERAPRS